MKTHLVGSYIKQDVNSIGVPSGQGYAPSGEYYMVNIKTACGNATYPTQAEAVKAGIKFWTTKNMQNEDVCKSCRNHIQAGRDWQAMHDAKMNKQVW